MLTINPVQNNTIFKSKVSCEKLAAQKLLKLTEEKITPTIIKNIENILHTSSKLTQATEYLAKEGAKTTSEKFTAEKLAKLTGIL